jgi:hypothetical protein
VTCVSPLPSIADTRDSGAPIPAAGRITSEEKALASVVSKK